MKYHLHENGWTVIVEDLDFNTVTQEEINLICKLVAKYTLVVVRGQKLSLQDEIRVLHMFKNPKPAFAQTDEYFEQNAADLVNDPTGLVCRVTGAKDEKGRTGIAGHEEEMAWHNNSPFDPDRSPIVWLYSVKGSEGSVTSYNNTILAYNDLDQETKNKIKDLKCIYFSGVRLEVGELGEAPNKVVNEEFNPPLVYTNIAGQVGLYLSPYLLENFVGLTKEQTKEIVDPLFEFVTQDKYCYHHHWKDGDVVLAEQWLGIHKRWPFKEIENRLLHRAAADFTDQDYV